MGRKIAYLRVSKPDQRCDRQFDGLQDICDELHIEKISAVSKKRPVYDAVIASLKEGDAFVVWDLDRAFRSVVDAIQEAEKLRNRGIEFQIVNLQVDTSTPAGMLVYTVMSAAAEFERNTLSQRTKEGLAAARKRGKRLGRPPKMSPCQIKQAQEDLQIDNTTITSVAEKYGVAPWTLSRSIKRLSA